MKRCPTCRQKSPDQDIFCGQCGTKLPANKTGKTKNLILLGVLILGTFITGTITGSLWSTKGDSPMQQNTAGGAVSTSYPELIVESEKLLEAGELDKAEKMLLQASERDPQQALPYEKLYAMYIAQSQLQKAEEIKDQAQQNIAQDQKPDFMASIDIITEDAKPDPARKEIADLGKLEFTPISFDGRGWLIRKDGVFSYLLPDGTIHEASGADTILVMDNGTISEAPGQNACLSSTVDYSTGYMISNGAMTAGASCGAGGFMVTHPYILDDQNNVVLTDQAISSQSSPLARGQDFTITSPIVVSHQPKAEGDYYIYLPKSEELFGPYAESESATFYSAAKKIPNLNFLMDMQKTSGPFWIHNPVEAYGNENGVQNRFSLLSEDGSKKLEGFSSAQAVDAFSIGAHRSHRFYSFDRDLKEVYTGLYEAGATAIDGAAPVKTDGTWKLISLEQSDANQNESSEAETAESSIIQPRPNTDFSALSGSYAAFSGGPSSISVDIHPDGTFAAASKSSAMGLSGPDYPAGTVYIGSVTGTLERVDDMRVRIASVKNEVPVGTSEIKNMMNFEYCDMEESFQIGAEFTLMPIGTPTSALSDISGMYLEAYGMKGETLSTPLLVDNRGIPFKKTD